MSGYTADSNPSSLGGGMPGFQPKLLGGGGGVAGGSGMDGGALRGDTRAYLRRGMGNIMLAKSATGNSQLQSAVGPFRIAFNAGDPMGTRNQAGLRTLPASNQVNGPNTAPGKLHLTPGAAANNGGSAYTGNPKFVYDGSDYTRFRRQTAVLRTYNDESFGGSNNGSFSFLQFVRG